MAPTTENRPYYHLRGRCPRSVGGKQNMNTIDDLSPMEKAVISRHSAEIERQWQREKRIYLLGTIAGIVATAVLVLCWKVFAA